jgi:hypothetical protein
MFSGRGDDQVMSAARQADPAPVRKQPGLATLLQPDAGALLH